MDDLSENLLLCACREKDLRGVAVLKESRAWDRPRVPEKVSFKRMECSIQITKDLFWKVRFRRSCLRSEVCSILPRSGPKKGVKFLTKNCKDPFTRNYKTYSTLKNWKM